MLLPLILIGKALRQLILEYRLRILDELKFLNVVVVNCKCKKLLLHDIRPVLQLILRTADVIIATTSHAFHSCRSALDRWERTVHTLSTTETVRS